MTAETHRASPTDLRRTAGTFWAVLFFMVFLAQPLDGTSERRWELLLRLLDPLLGVASDARAAITDSLPQVSFLDSMMQRLPLYGAAAGLWFVALAQGTLAVVLLPQSTRLSRLERWILAAGVGLSLQSLWTLLMGLLGQLNRLAVVLPAFLCLAAFLIWRWRKSRGAAGQGVLPRASTVPRSSVLFCLAVVVPFAAWLLLGACSPPTDFDVREYHLQGPKEWFQAGCISYLQHNVYTSFPFLTEMLLLSGMVLAGDWWTGALAGQIALTAFPLLSIASVFAIGRRWLTEETAWLAVLVGLTIPWTLRISIIPYAEGGLTFYLTASVMLASIAIPAAGEVRRPLWIATGFLAGSAMASKYTGLVAVVAPIGLWITVAELRRQPSDESKPERRLQRWWVRWRSGLCAALHAGLYFGMGVSLAVGPWLLRNLVDTGNPVFPLAYHIFGGNEWNPELDVRWQRAHSATEHNLLRIPDHLLDALLRNSWTSGLLAAFAVPAGLLCRSRPVAWLLACCGWQLFVWWAFTHRIDRFWIPVIPLLSLLAAEGCRELCRSRLRPAVLLVLVSGIAYHVSFCTTRLVGYHAGLSDLVGARQLVIRDDLRHLNQALPADARVLMVGEAEVFDATFRLAYNTVFDDSLLERWTAGSVADASGTVVTYQPREAIASTLRNQHITHVYVNWSEILRYRRPGSYDYAPFVQPQRLADLVALGILKPATPLLAQSWDSFSAEDQRLLSGWPGINRLRTVNGQLTTTEIFEVVP